MQPTSIKVCLFPDASNCLEIAQDLLVIAVHTPLTTVRTEARQRIRLALKQVLAKKLNCTLSEIEFFSEAGKALKLMRPKHAIGLSISHESGLSIAAINMCGRVGVDLMLKQNSLTYEEMHQLATDYLGIETAELISHLPNNLQHDAFAKAWTTFEAQLKCQEQQITEWNPSRERLPNSETFNLILPVGYIGSLVRWN